VDYRRRLPGRGAYTCPDPDCVATAVKRQQFKRALRASFSSDTQKLLEELAGQLRQRVADLVGMARKAGQVRSGAQQVRTALRETPPPALVLLAEDIAKGQDEQWQSRLQAAGVRCYHCLYKYELGERLGRCERSVMALMPGGIATALEEELERLQLFQGRLNG